MDLNNYLGCVLYVESSYSHLPRCATAVILIGLKMVFLATK